MSMPSSKNETTHKRNEEQSRKTNWNKAGKKLSDKLVEKSKKTLTT